MVSFREKPTSQRVLDNFLLIPLFTPAFLIYNASYNGKMRIWRTAPYKLTTLIETDYNLSNKITRTGQQRDQFQAHQTLSCKDGPHATVMHITI